MSVNVIENLSLLESQASFLKKPDRNSAQQERGFADRLARALSGDSSSEPSSVSAKALAESLSLKMLHSSLSLAGDIPEESSLAHSINSMNSLLNAYSANHSANVENQDPSSSKPSTSQFQELSASRDDFPPRVEKQAKPRDSSWLDPIIAKASRHYGIDVSLIKAVIKTESDFNPQAVSHAGARGLMQLMPATAKSLGVNDSFDPEQNVMAGTRFLSDMLQRYNGNIDSALAAYNWGPGNVDRHPDRMPRETRDYLQKVKKLYSSYTS